MKPTTTLFAKILILFFINLFVLIAILVIFLTLQSRMDFMAILGSTSGDRFRIASRQIAYELGHSPEPIWPDILKRYEEMHGVGFTLVTRTEMFQSREIFIIPEEVRRESLSLIRLKPPRFPERQYDMPREERIKNRNRQSFRRPYLRMRTENPTQYWIGTRIFLKSGREFPPKSTILLARSGSLTGNGFFFDPVPWVIVAIVIVVVSVLFWIPFVRHITRPLARMTSAAEEIARGKFNVEIKEKRSDEIGRLASAINHMTHRLSGYVKGQRRFLGDVAHELGSPIARIQFGLGILENEIKDSHDEQLNDVLEDVAELSILVNELLSFTRAEISPERVQLESLLLHPLVERAVQRESVEDTEILIEIPGEMKVTGNATLLTRALANLIRNAVRYAGNKGPVIVTASREEEKTEIIVRDSGPGIPDEHLDKLFDPFYRPESARDRESGGVGLGLTIVKTCVEVCEGSVSAQNLNPSGFAVTLILNS